MTAHPHSVCKAALDWECRAEPSWISDTRSPSRADAEAVLKKARTAGAAERGAAVATHAEGTVRQLPETPDDVLPNTLSRLGPNMYQGTLRSGTIWRGDAELLMSLPQGEARLATLQTRERVAHAKAKAKGKAKANEGAPRDQENPAESTSSAARRGGGDLIIIINNIIITINIIIIIIIIIISSIIVIICIIIIIISIIIYLLSL